MGNKPVIVIFSHETATTIRRYLIVRRKAQIKALQSFPRSNQFKKALSSYPVFSEPN